MRDRLMNIEAEVKDVGDRKFQTKTFPDFREQRQIPSDAKENSSNEASNRDRNRQVATRY